MICSCDVLYIGMAEAVVYSPLAVKVMLVILLITTGTDGLFSIWLPLKKMKVASDVKYLGALIVSIEGEVVAICGTFRAWTSIR